MLRTLVFAAAMLPGAAMAQDKAAMCAEALEGLREVDIAVIEVGDSMDRLSAVMAFKAHEAEGIIDPAYFASIGREAEGNSVAASRVSVGVEQVRAALMAYCTAE